MTPEIKKIIDAAIASKTNALEVTDQGFMNPSIFIEREGSTWAVITAPNCDKNQALDIAKFCRFSFEPEFITLVIDTYHADRGKDPNLDQMILNGETTLEKEFKKGNAAISECITLFRIDDKCKIEFAYVLYKEENKRITWSESQLLPEEFSGEKLEGTVPGDLTTLMSDKFSLAEVAKDINEDRTDPLSLDQLRFHLARSILQFLGTKGCLVKDYFSKHHMDWIDYKGKAAELIEMMVEKGLVPEEAVPYLEEVVEKHLGERSFGDEFADLLRAYPYWLPSSVRGEEDMLAASFEKTCMIADVVDMTKIYPHIHKIGDSLRKQSKRNYFPKRVKVWDGSGQNYIGEGNYVDDVKVYFIQKSDGSIESLKNAEEEPSPFYIGEEDKVIVADENPKIVLDSGETVYGCQVWFDLLEDKKTEDKKQESPQEAAKESK